MHVGAVLQKCGHDGPVPLFDSPHERGLPAQLFAGVHVGASADEQLDHFGAAAPGSRHERCLARLELDVRVRAGLEQPPGHGRAAVDTRQPDGGRAEVVRRIDVRSRAEEEVGCCHVVAMGGPVQRRRAVALRGIHVDSRPQQRPHAVDRSALHGIDQRIGGLSRPGQSACGDERQQRDHNRKAPRSWKHDPTHPTTARAAADRCCARACRSARPCDPSTSGAGSQRAFPRRT